MKHALTRPLRIAFTGGGTGGHIYPIIAVVEELQRIAAESKWQLDLRFIGDPDPYGALLEQNGVHVVRVASAKFRRYLSIENLLDLPKFAFHLAQSLWRLFWFMPDILFSKGGTGALGPVLAAAWYRIPTIIHESDVAPGLTNLISSRFAHTVLLGFQEAQRSFPRAHGFVTTGNPVRRSLLASARHRTKNDKAALGFDPDAPLTLVWGGSQGSERINMLIAISLRELLQTTQLFHLTGGAQYESLSAKIAPALAALSESARRRYKAAPYVERELGDLLAAADLAVSRGGAGTIAECSAFGVPMLIIPLPEAAGNHQFKNALAAERAGCAIVLEEEAMHGKPELLIEAVRSLIGNVEKRAMMRESGTTLSAPEAAFHIAQIIVELTVHGRRSGGENRGKI